MNSLERDAGYHQFAQDSGTSERHAGYHQFGQDIGASALCYLSWALWHLGYVDQASEAATEAMKLAEKLSHPYTLVLHDLPCPRFHGSLSAPL